VNEALDLVAIWSGFSSTVRCFYNLISLHLRPCSQSDESLSCHLHKCERIYALAEHLSCHLHECKRIYALAEHLSCHLHKCKRIYALAEHLEKFLIFMQALTALRQVSREARIYTSGNPVLKPIFIYQWPPVLRQ
jgi:hypothetical protein